MNSWLIFSIVGVFVGTLAGLFGIGGGLITVPIIFYILSEQLRISHPTAVLMAIKTSLAIIIFTSTLSVYSHNKISRIAWNIVKELAPGVLIGTMLGSLLSTYIPAIALEIMFTTYVCLVAMKMWFGFNVQSSENSAPSSKLNYFVGGIIGIKSAILGIGGGTITIPYLSWQGVPIHKSVGVSASVGFVIAVSATVTAFFQSTSEFDLPEYSLGFIYLPALLCVSTTGLLFTRIGSKLSYRLPQQKMRKAFALFLMIIAIKSITRLI